MFKKIAVGISGGVDSSVTAYLLKKKGYDVCGVYMKNWDIADEQGICSSDKDFRDAQIACDTLKLPLVEVNFVKEYWNDVFLNFVDDYEHGFTPNPDILCNKHVKFNYFYRYARDTLNCDAIATGHYANSSFDNYLESYQDGVDVKLLKAKDCSKDQTFFLSQIQQDALRRTMFPLGNMLKKDVKSLARKIGLEQFAKKKESMGICFIGSRNFKHFIREYITDRQGTFVDIDTGKVVGEHNGIHQWTIGQRSKLGGFSQSYYIAKKCAKTDTIYVASGRKHPALYSSLFFTEKPLWIRPSAKLTQNDCFDCSFKFQHIHDQCDCRVMQTRDGMAILVNGLKRALAPGQYAVFYQNDECLGSARIISAGVSNFSLGWLANNEKHSSVIYNGLSYTGEKLRPVGME